MDPIKIYWEEFPESETQIKEVVNTNTHGQTGKILNSTEVHVPKKSNYKRNLRQSSVKKKPVNLEKLQKQNASNLIEDNPNLSKDAPKTDAALKDLSASEKQKIAKLVQELAKFSGEKEAALKELETVRTQYCTNLKRLQQEKEQAVKKHDMLKEKLLEYEIMIDEIKQASKLKQLVEYQKSAEKELRVEVKEKVGEKEKNIFHDFSDLFEEQEKKFRLQQEQLQQQIDQVQKLQSSLMHQRSELHKSLQNETLTSEIGENTKKLESYISSASEQHSRMNCEVPQPQDHKRDTSTTMLPDNEDIKRTHVNVVHTKPNFTQTPDSLDTHTVVTKKSTIKKISNKKLQMLSAKESTPPIAQMKNESTRKHPTSSISVDYSEEENVKTDALLSPIQRKHFQPSSIIELVEGLQPQSTSTSVDQYSLRRAAVQKKTTTQKSSTLKSVYGASRKPNKHQEIKSRSEVEEMEKDILDDVFFI